MTDNTDEFEPTPGETAATAAQQLSIMARDLSWAVGDVITEWQKHAGHLDGDIMADLHSHKRRLDGWLRTYERLSIAESQ